MESNNRNDRIRYLVLHYTALDYERSVRALTETNGASAHYLIPEGNDPTYPDRKLRIIQLVAEKDRAWHAGISHWQGQDGLNDQSIGIEIVNQPYCDGLTSPDIYDLDPQSEMPPDEICFFPDYDGDQIKLVTELCLAIIQRYPDIDPTKVIGHSDIAPGRKIDPGPRFPWYRLHKAGVGAWYERETVAKYWNIFQKDIPPVQVIQNALIAYGYKVPETGILDAPTISALKSFQLHFRPWQVDGAMTPKTVATLFALLERYFPEKLERIQSDMVIP